MTKITLTEREWAESFAFEMWSATTFDLPSIDAFLEDPRVPADVLGHLLETREEALHAYKQGNYDHAVATFRTLHASCLYYGQNLAVKPEIQRARASQSVRLAANRANARQPRPGAHRVDHYEVLKEFKRLVTERHTEGEARGILVSRGLASQSTIYRITKKSIL